MDYTGYKQIHLTDDELAQFYSTSVLPYNFIENEYLILINENGDAVDYYIRKNNEFKKVKFPIIGNDFTGEMKPRNPQQYCALDMLKRDDIPIKLLTGTFGSGKSMACITAVYRCKHRSHIPARVPGR